VKTRIEPSSFGGNAACHPPLRAQGEDTDPAPVGLLYERPYRVTDIVLSRLFVGSQVHFTCYDWEGVFPGHEESFAGPDLQTVAHKKHRFWSGYGGESVHKKPEMLQ